MMSMTNDETYQGWANRETWAFNLHWSNDQGLYNSTLDQAREFLAAYAEDEDDRNSDFQIGEYIVNFWREYLDDVLSPTSVAPPALHMFDREVGSWWRIDYAEVGAAVRESLDNES